MAEEMKAIRVALLTQGYSTGGGVPAVARWLADGLRATGRIDVDVFNLATSATDPHSRRTLRPRTWFKRSLRGPNEDGAIQFGANAVEFEWMRYRARRELTGILRSYDIVQVVGGSPALAAVALKCGTPVIVQTATTVRWERQSQFAVDTGLTQLWRRLMTRATSHTEVRALRQSAAIMVENDDMYEFVVSLGQKHVQKAPPGVDTDTFTPSAEWQADGYLLSLCRLGDARKGLDRLIRAYSAMRIADSLVPRLVIAGRGTLRPDVAKLIDDLGLSNYVDVQSDVPLDDLAGLLRGASVFIQTSHEEGLGISVVEAMASGLPVVATETAGSRQTVVDGTTGRLVPQNDEDDLIDGLAIASLDLLRDGHTAAAAARLRAVERFSLEVTLKRFIDEYDSALSPSCAGTDVSR